MEVNVDQRGYGMHMSMDVFSELSQGHILLSRKGQHGERKISSLVLNAINELQIETLPVLLHLGFPLPLGSVFAFASSPSNALINTPQLQCEPWAQLLQSSANALDTLERFALSIDNALLCCALITEGVSEASYEDEISLVV